MRPLSALLLTRTKPRAIAGFALATDAASRLLAVSSPGEGQGADSVTVLQCSLGQCSLLHQVQPPGGTPVSRFGADLALSGSDLWVGDPFAGGNTGVVHRYQGCGPDSSCGSLASLTAPPGTPELKAQWFGWKVVAEQINIDSFTLVVGAPISQVGAVINAGAAFFYKCSALACDKLVGIITQPSGPLGPVPLLGATLGYSLALDGDRVAVGAPFADGGAGADSRGRATVEMGTATIRPP
eukprot:gene7234-1291_t